MFFLKAQSPMKVNCKSSSSVIKLWEDPVPSLGPTLPVFPHEITFLSICMAEQLRRSKREMCPSVPVTADGCSFFFFWKCSIYYIFYVSLYFFFMESQEQQPFCSFFNTTSKGAIIMAFHSPERGQPFRIPLVTANALVRKTTIRSMWYMLLYNI